jgi:hypothetical protein
MFSLWIEVRCEIDDTLCLSSEVCFVAVRCSLFFFHSFTIIVHFMLHCRSCFTGFREYFFATS